MALHCWLQVSVCSGGIMWPAVCSAASDWHAAPGAPNEDCMARNDSSWQSCSATAVAAAAACWGYCSCRCVLVLLLLLHSSRRHVPLREAAADCTPVQKNDCTTWLAAWLCWAPECARAAAHVHNCCRVWEARVSVHWWSLDGGRLLLWPQAEWAGLQCRQPVAPPCTVPMAVLLP